MKGSASRPWRERRALVLVLVGLGLVIVGAGSNLVAGAVLRARHPVPGAFYRIGNGSMHLYCVGQGSPTVVLEGGLGDDWLYWQQVQPKLAATMRVCTYDRSGLGWSDLQPGPRDARHIAADLHALLIAAGEPRPIVLAGASAGGFYVRQFVASYPAEVIAVVFVDGSVPDQIRVLPGGAYSADVARHKHRDARWDWVKEASGWARLRGHCEGEVERGLEAYADLARAEACRPSFTTTWLGEWDEFWHSAEEAAEARCCGDLPVLVISQDPDRPKPGWTPQMVAAQPIWNALQETLKKLSPHSRRIIARGSGHHVMTDRPDVVTSGIQQVVTGLRARTPTHDDGSTIVQ